MNVTHQRDRRSGKFFRLDNDVHDIARNHGVMILAVYTVLAKHANQHGSCFPAMKTIAEALGISEPTVKRAISTLKKGGHIAVKRRVGRSGTFDSNEYQINRAPYSPGITDDPRSDDHHGSLVIPTRDHGCASPGLTGDPLTRLKEQDSYEQDAPGISDDPRSDGLVLVASDLLRVLGDKHQEDGFVWKVAYLVANGQLAQVHAVEAAESVRENSPDNPIGYFRTVLSSNVGGDGKLKFMLNTVPRTVKPEPLACPSSDFGRPKRADTTCLNVED